MYFSSGFGPSSGSNYVSPLDPNYGSSFSPNYGSSFGPNYGSPLGPNYGSPPGPNYGSPPGSNFGPSYGFRPPSQRTSFPELVGRSVQEAVAVISAQGLNPVPVRPNQPLTMDFQSNRVRIVTCPSGRMVMQIPTVG